MEKACEERTTPSHENASHALSLQRRWDPHALTQLAGRAPRRLRSERFLRSERRDLKQLVVLRSRVQAQLVPEVTKRTASSKADGLRCMRTLPHHIGRKGAERRQDRADHGHSHAAPSHCNRTTIAEAAMNTDRAKPTLLLDLPHKAEQSRNPSTDRVEEPPLPPRAEYDCVMLRPLAKLDASHFCPHKNWER